MSTSTSEARENFSLTLLLSFFLSAPDNLCKDFASTAFLNIFDVTPSTQISADENVRVGAVRCGAVCSARAVVCLRLVSNFQFKADFSSNTQQPNMSIESFVKFITLRTEMFT